MKYIKKAIPIEAFQYKGDFIENGEYCIPEWAIKAYEDGLLCYKDEGDLYIHTLEGEMKCGLNSYIVQGVRGEIYHCRQDILEEKYKGGEERRKEY